MASIQHDDLAQSIDDFADHIDQLLTAKEQIVDTIGIAADPGTLHATVEQKRGLSEVLQDAVGNSVLGGDSIHRMANDVRKGNIGMIKPFLDHHFFSLTHTIGRHFPEEMRHMLNGGTNKNFSLNSSLPIPTPFEQLSEIIGTVSQHAEKGNWDALKPAIADFKQELQNLQTIGRDIESQAAAISKQKTP